MRQFINILSVGIILVIGVIVLAWVIIPHESVKVPHITLASAQSSPVVATHSFPFEQAAVTIMLPVDAALYNGAKNTDKSVAIRGNVYEKGWVSDSYRGIFPDDARAAPYR